MRARLEDFCRLEFGAGDLKVTALNRIPEGHSGFTYFVDLECAPYPRLVLRLPPPGAQPKGPADVARQGRIMSALRARGLPVPAVPVICDDPQALDGRPFILMEAVDGVRADVAASREDNTELARAAVAAMKQLHAVPAEGTGIAGESVAGLPEELNRWSKLIDRAPQELTARADELRRSLAKTMPPGSPRAGLVHGDFTFGNLLFRGTEVAAVLDWEIAGLGEPLLDLGSLCVIAKRHDFPKDPNPSGAVRASVEWLIDEYGAASQPVEWFVALSYFKYAAIVGYNTMLHRRGKRPDPIYDLMPDTVIGLIDGALEILS
ncbi:phosphotransferase family protein [Amycolatopsis sp. K13G38]|uniref:Phosphotransferase family protein n=1 Tax=Amycolatopsis acididurans TaxID=2724524 RepID=A0ABX1J8S1_9PSEU|nr:phosphotransferase family protein [Amycolatopsis acididurans]NKQ56177.1 phosphotransferase family protein [Amycolatopsis acididurans]